MTDWRKRTIMATSPAGCPPAGLWDAPLSPVCELTQSSIPNRQVLRLYRPVPRDGGTQYDTNRLCRVANICRICVGGDGKEEVSRGR